MDKYDISLSLTKKDVIVFLGIALFIYGIFNFMSLF